jgi:hypothetical protein
MEIVLTPEQNKILKELADSVKMSEQSFVNYLLSQLTTQYQKNPLMLKAYLKMFIK